MILSMFVLALSLSFTGSFSVNDIREVGAYTYDSKYDNLSGSIDIYYSFAGTPSNAPSIQIKTQSSVLVNHQMTASDFYSGTPNTGLSFGNIYKYTYNIDVINHTTTYYFNIVNDTNSSISYMGNNINFYINANVLNYSDSYNEGYIAGLEQGQQNCFETCENSSFSFDWLVAIFDVPIKLLNIEIIPGLKLWYIIGIPLAIGLVVGLLKLWR